MVVGPVASQPAHASPAMKQYVCSPRNFILERRRPFPFFPRGHRHRLGKLVCGANVDIEATADLLDTEKSPDELWKGLDVPRRKAGKKRKLIILGLAAALEYWATSACG